MAGDPGDILSTSAVKYVERMTNDATELFNQLLQIARKISSMANVKEKINILNSFCKKYKIEKDNPDSIKSCVLNETYYRIASSILQNNEIYGFTVAGIMQNKKFPPANHIVTSLFVKNPHEKPREQSVSDIFSSDKSILLFAHPEQILRFNNVYKQSASKIIDTFNPKYASLAEKNMNKAASRFAYQVMKHENPDSSSMNEMDPKEQKKISDIIDKVVIKAIDMAISQKRRCLQCSGIAHDMIIRVTDLAKRCVVSMLNVEKSMTDIKSGNKTYYNSGNTPQNIKRINKQLERNKQHIDRNPNDSNY
jgi:5-bromo-4-chloroindolyl phosphate hydrolysis protein